MATRPFIVYKASAGSGKTYALAKEYLKMAFSLGPGRLDEGFRSILAITFTKKATGEMKDRILDDLEKIARKPAVPHSGGIAADVLDALNDDGIATTPEQLQEMAARLRSTILHHYSDLSVSTIDSFMHRIVRTFAHDMGQPMNFDVMLDEDKIVDEAVALLLSLIGTEGEEELTDMMKSYAESNMEEGGSYRIERSIKELAKLLFDEDTGKSLKQLSALDFASYKAIRQGYAKEAREHESDIRRLAAEMLRELDSIGLDSSMALRGKNGYYGYLCRLAVADDVGKMPGKSTVQAFEEGQLTGKKCPAGIAAAAEAALPRLKRLYDGMMRGIVYYNTCNVLKKQLYSTALLNRLDKLIRQYSHENEIIHLSEFNKMINAVVEDEDNPAPFIFERLGNRYRHFLVDEFQDTSIMQWHNLVPLLENGVSQRHESLVVGDGKQSIYRFRQGDVQQFLRLPHVDGMKHHGKTLSLPGNHVVKELKENRRSGEAIVKFNNEFFSYLARYVYSDNPLVQSIYIGHDAEGGLLPERQEELRQLPYKKYKGHVEVDIVSKDDAAEGGFESVDDAIFDGVLRTIRHLVEHCGYRYKDIVVLARNNAELATIGNYLSAHSDIPQTSTESFYLSESHAVMAVIAVLRLLRNGADRCAEADLHFRLASLGIDGGRWAEVCERWANGVSSLPPGLDMPYLASLDIYDCCEEIVRMLHLDGIDTLYVASLLDRVAGFAAKHRQDVGDFLEWFDEQKSLSAASSEEADAVQMLSIHKSKGLGKPVVICTLWAERSHAPRLWVDVPDGMKRGDSPSLPTARVELPSEKSTLFDAQFNHETMLNDVDELNALYVALTRPKEQLFIFCPDPADRSTAKAHDRSFPTLLSLFVDNRGYDRGDEDFRHLEDEDDKAPKPQRRITHISHPDWTGRVLIASPSEKAITPLQEGKIRFGIYAHDLLAGVRHADDVEAAIERFRATGQATDEEMHRLAELARRVVGDEAARRFFAPGHKVKNECELVTDGRRVRPDRVVFTPDETWVVDFKTGEHLDGYRKQVNDYCRALREMGCPNVSGWLLYLQPDVAVEKVEN